jgi:PAS domain S-box-containing protein
MKNLINKYYVILFMDLFILSIFVFLWWNKNFTLSKEIVMGIILFILIIHNVLLFIIQKEENKRRKKVLERIKKITSSDFLLELNSENLSSDPFIQQINYYLADIFKRVSDLQRLNESLSQLIESNQNMLQGRNREKQELEKFVRKLLIALENLPFPIAIVDKDGNIIFQNGLTNICSPESVFNSLEKISLIDLLKDHKCSGWDKVKQAIHSQKNLEIMLVQRKNNFKHYWKLMLLPYMEELKDEKNIYFLSLFIDFSPVKYREKIFEYVQKISYIATGASDEDDLYKIFNLLLLRQFKIPNYFIFLRDNESGRIEVIHSTQEDRNYLNFVEDVIQKNYIDILHAGSKEVVINYESRSDEEDNDKKKNDKKNMFLFHISSENEDPVIIALEWEPEIHKKFTEDLKLLFEQFIIILNLFYEHKRMLMSEHQFRKIFEESQNALIEYDEHGIILKCNQSAVELLEMNKKEELLQRNFFDFFEQKDDIIFYNHIIESVGSIKDLEINMRTDKNRRIHVALSVIQIKDWNNEVKGYRASLHDLTAKLLIEEMLVRKNKELKQVNQRLKETQAQLIHQEKLASIGQLAAGIAHEINNPLGFVYSNFNTLKKYTDRLLTYIQEINEKIKEFGNDAFITLSENVMKKLKIDFIMEDLNALFQDSEEGFERITKIVQNMRTFSRVDYAEEKEEYDLNQGIESTLIVAKNVYKYYADIKKELSPIPTIQAIGNEINQVLLNVITNAAQAIKSQNRKEKGIISIKTYEEDEYVVCEISDDGPGIPEKYLNKIFDPFFTTKPAGEGTGLGLHISYDIIVNKHKGMIKVQTQEGKGTTFIIKLPKMKLNHVREDQENGENEQAK